MPLKFCGSNCAACTCPTAGWLTSDNVGLQAVDTLVSLHRQASRNIRAAVEHTTSMGRGECSVAWHVLHCWNLNLAPSASYPPDGGVNLHHLPLHHAPWHPSSTLLAPSRHLPQQSDELHCMFAHAQHLKPSLSSFAAFALDMGHWQ